MGSFHKPKRFYFCIYIILLCPGFLICQEFEVRGNINTNNNPVKNSQIIFTSSKDSLQKFSAYSDSSGNYKLSIVTSVNNNVPPVPSKFELVQNYPNPFSGITSIPYKLNETAEVRVSIYNVLGEEVRKFNPGEQYQGVYKIQWDGKSSFGVKVAPGVYFCKLNAKNDSKVIKMVLGSNLTNENLYVTGSNILKMNKEKFDMVYGSYSINILCNDFTVPKIKERKLNNITIQSDTILNFSVYEDKQIIRLENQTEHSGIMVKIVELDQFTITDSTGRFDFNSIKTDGFYTLTAKYPYFEPQDIPIEIEKGKIINTVELELKQLLQFWIEPAETTISLNNRGNLNSFSYYGFRQYQVNITETKVELASFTGPLNVTGFLPVNDQWPYVSNPDNSPEYCLNGYGRFVGDNTLAAFISILKPFDTTFSAIGGFGSKSCFKAGIYLLFSAISDLAYYPEYFYPGLLFIEGDNQHLYQKMNLSLFKKLQLFRPAKVHIVNM